MVFTCIGAPFANKLADSETGLWEMFARQVRFSVVARGVLLRHTSFALALFQRAVVTRKVTGLISRGGKPQHEAARDGCMLDG